MANVTFTIEPRQTRSQETPMPSRPATAIPVLTDGAVVLSKSGKTYIIHGEPSVRLNGQTLVNAVQLRGGKAYGPVRYMRPENFQAVVNYDESGRAVL